MPFFTININWEMSDAQLLQRLKTGGGVVAPQLVQSVLDSRVFTETATRRGEAIKLTNLKGF